MRKPKFIYFNPFFRFAPRTISKLEHIFVVGAPRSGTTLVANVISNHSRICSLRAETNIFSWQTCFVLYEGMAGRNSHELNRLRRKHTNVVGLFDEIASTCKEENNARHFLEKTPQHVLHLDFILKHFPNAKVVNVVRDPRDAYLSSKSNQAVAQQDAKAYAHYWKKSIISRLKHSNNAAIIDIQYESLTNQPSAQVEKVTNWLGLKYEATQTHPSEMSDHPLAGKKEFGLLGKKISNERNGLYKTKLTPEEINNIEKTVGASLFTYGYQTFEG